MKKILSVMLLLGALAMPACIMVVVNDRPDAEEEWDDDLDDEDEEDADEREDKR